MLQPGNTHALRRPCNFPFSTLVLQLFFYHYLFHVLEMAVLHFYQLFLLWLLTSIVLQVLVSPFLWKMWLEHFFTMHYNFFIRGLFCDIQLYRTTTPIRASSINNRLCSQHIALTWITFSSSYLTPMFDLACRCIKLEQIFPVEYGTEGGPPFSLNGPFLYTTRIT